MLDKFRPLVLNAGKVTQTPGTWDWQNITSPFMRLYYIEKGQAAIHLADSRLTLHPGHLYLIPSFVTHSYECTQTFTHYYIHLYEAGGVMDSILDHWQLPYEAEAGEMEHLLMQRLCDDNPEFTLPGSDPQLYDNSVQLHNNLHLNRQRPLSRRMASRGIVLQLFSRLMEQATPRTIAQDERIAASVAFIHQHLTEDLSINLLAQQHSMVDDTFIRLFRSELGITPMRYINRKRMEQAQFLLTTTHLNSKEIAHQVGIFDQNYFSRLFRRLVGVSPLQYRSGKI